MKIYSMLLAGLLSAVSYNAMASAVTCATAQAGDPNNEVDELAIYTTWWMSDAAIVGTPAYVIVGNNPNSGSSGAVSNSVRTNSNGAYDDCIVISGNGTVGNSLLAYAGNDTFRMSGNASVGGSILAAEGNDDVELSDDIRVGADIDLGTGNDSLSMSGKAVVEGNILGGDGDDEITLNDAVSVADINMDDGSDALTINGSDVILNGVLDGGDDVSFTDSYTDSLTFNNWSGTTPNMMNWEIIQLTASQMDLGGGTTVETEQFNIDATSTLITQNGNHEITGNVNNLGTINMSDNIVTAGGLTVGGDYTGSGAIILDVDLGNLVSDTLFVGGDVNAQGTLDFNRIGNDHDGTGASILVIDAPNDDQSTVSSFQFDASVGGSAYIWALTNVPGSGFYLGHVPNDAPKPASYVLPGVAAYVSLPTIGREMALSYVSNLHDRLGELRRLEGWIGTGEQNLKTAISSQWSNHPAYIDGSWNVWVKGIIAGFDVDGNDTYQVDGTYGGLDIGADYKFDTNRNDFIIYGGLFGGYRTGNFSTDGTSARYGDSLIGSDIDARSWSLGAYATLFWDNTTYLDVVANYISLDTDLSSNDYYINEYTTIPSYSGSVSGDALALSAELGHRIDLAKSWIIEPQVQLIYLSVDWDDIENSTYQVHYGNGDYLMARAGLRIEKTVEIGEDSEFKPWVRANIIHEFGDAVTVDINNSAFDSYKFDTYAQFDLGTTYVINDTFQIYGSGSYHTDFSNYDAYEMSGGMRMSW